MRHAVSGGDRVGVPPLTLEPGVLAETVTVVAESPLVQTQSGERSFGRDTFSMSNMFLALRKLARSGDATIRMSSAPISARLVQPDH